METTGCASWYQMCQTIFHYAPTSFFFFLFPFTLSSPGLGQESMQSNYLLLPDAQPRVPHIRFPNMCSSICKLPTFTCQTARLKASIQITELPGEGLSHHFASQT